MVFSKFNLEKGFITLEILLSMMILTLLLSAITLLSFGGLSVLDFGQEEREVREVGERLLAQAKRRLEADFKDVPIATTTTIGKFRTALSVKTLDYFTRQLTVIINEIDSRNPPSQWEGSLILTDYRNTANDDTCDPLLAGDWSMPRFLNPVTDFATLVSSSTGVYPITDLDVYDQRLYVTTSNTSINQNTFFVFDVADLAAPRLLASLDNDLINNTGIKALTVHGNIYERYAYVANSSSFVKGQLQIIDVLSSPIRVVTTYKIPTGIVAGTSGQGNGNSIAYKEGYVYLGLTKTVSGPEFNIIDVHNPLAPTWVGGYSVGNSINDIYIRDGFAYLATPNNQELITLDIADPAHPTLVGGFDAPDSVGSGKSLYLVGDSLYLGRTVTAAHPELYRIDNSDPRSVPSAPLATYESGSSVNGLIARGDLLFLATNGGQVRVLNIASSTNMIVAGSLLLPNSGQGMSLDCEGNTLFVASVPSAGAFSNRGAISIITSQ